MSATYKYAKLDLGWKYVTTDTQVTSTATGNRVLFHICFVSTLHESLPVLDQASRRAFYLWELFSRSKEAPHGLFRIRTPQNFLLLQTNSLNKISQGKSQPFWSFSETGTCYDQRQTQQPHLFPTHFPKSKLDGLFLSKILYKRGWVQIHLFYPHLSCVLTFESQVTSLLQKPLPVDTIRVTPIWGWKLPFTSSTQLNPPWSLNTSFRTILRMKLICCALGLSFQLNYHSSYILNIVHTSHSPTLQWPFSLQQNQVANPHFSMEMLSSLAVSNCNLFSTTWLAEGDKVTTMIWLQDDKFVKSKRIRALNVPTAAACPKPSEHPKFKFLFSPQGLGKYIYCHLAWRPAVAGNSLVWAGIQENGKSY